MRSEFRSAGVCTRNKRAGQFLILLLASFLVPGGFLKAQVLTPDGTLSTGGSGRAAMKNSMGVSFVEIPGTPVLFAAWETRVADFAAFLRESGYQWNYQPHFSQRADHPVVNVTMRDAIAYCNWLTKREQDAGNITALQSYRLPTRKEWDAAVGLASGRKIDPISAELEADKLRFPWGMEWPPPARAANLNFSEISSADDGYVYTAPVGLFPPSAEGIYDLGGNVWEWTWDPDTQSESVGVLRGGSWMYFRKECLLSSYQYEVPSTLRAPSIGFRCVMEDRQRVATFLASAKQAELERGAKTRSTIAGTSGVSPEEVQRMRDEIEKKSQGRPTLPALPDPSTLKPAKAGLLHVNSLGMQLRPVAEDLPILIGEHEVRVQDYELAMTALKKPWERKPSFAITAKHPIVNVTWAEAVEFCDWLTKREQGLGLIGPKDRYRLPKDLEWSRAAGLASESGETPESRHLAEKAAYPWGVEWPPPGRSANLDTARMTEYQDNFSHAAPVGSHTPNSLQLHDFAGNVSEWCEDAWSPGSPDRVIRGSSWLTSSKDDMLISARRHLPEGTARPEIGFRVVLELAAP